jgi:hypothetical protein
MSSVRIPSSISITCSIAEYAESEISFSKIMVAIDGSEESFDAASYAISLAEVYHSEPIALYVVSDVTQNDYYSDM